MSIVTGVGGGSRNSTGTSELVVMSTEWFVGISGVSTSTCEGWIFEEDVTLLKFNSGSNLRDTGDIFFKKRRLRNVIRRLPSTTTWYCLCGITSETTPVLNHLFGWFPP